MCNQIDKIENNMILDNIIKIQKLKKLPILERIYNKQIILYGAGNLGKMAKLFLEKLNIPFLCVIDKNSDLYIKDSVWSNTKIYGIDEIDETNILKKDNILLIICVANESYVKIYYELKEKGWKNIFHFYDLTNIYKYPINNGWYSGKLLNEDISNIKKILLSFNDDVSKSHYIQFIAWHIIREEWCHDDSSIIINNRYFIPEIKSALTDEETFVDIGSHHGETVNKFMSVVNNKFKCIYAIEPDIENVSYFMKNIGNLMDKYNIHLIPKAFSDNKERKRFYYGLDYISQLNILAKDKVDVNVLDNLNIKPTFIKIHTEGSEYDIINGGETTIINNRPILAVTTYHNRDGLWKIQTKLMELLKNYVFYFRLHSWAGSGSVIYAIPKERIK